MSHAPRRYPIGAEPNGQGTAFRVWAPNRNCVIVVGTSGGRSFEQRLEREPTGYFSGTVPGVMVGATYRFRLDDDTTLFPDPASRFQPEGPHGPSMVVDPASFQWSDKAWLGAGRQGQVIYEMHVGTFTPEGTWESALQKLPHLKQTGITLVEVMPLADFAGEFGWGYDGVNLFAPTRLYGTPDDFRRFVDRAHELGIGVILDVVYNHFGPDGNYLKAFSDSYFSSKHETDWGEAVNFDGEQSGPVREFVLTNARYWIQEFHLDGLRLDATQNIYDASCSHILKEMTAAARDAAEERSIYIVAENEPQETHHVAAPEQGGFGMDALWNDDLHHSLHVALTGRAEAYYTDYRGAPQEFISAMKWGYLYQGQWYKWQEKRRGHPALQCPPTNFVAYIENHDQVANSGRGQRMAVVSSPAMYRTLTALMLLGPSTPMLFQGQEFGATSHFYYFADHRPELATLVDEGRRKFLAQFPSLATPEMQAQIPRPQDRSTFERSKLDWSEVDRHPEASSFFRDLLTLRRTDPVISAESSNIDGAVLTEEAFLIRFFADDGLDRLLLVNLGVDADLSPVPEPLLAEPAGCRWTLIWSSEDPRYGGEGTPTSQLERNCHLPAHSALLFAARPQEES
ncbi:Malto-oligosyltrehalose trehalohydrolase [Caulifigura coniformis]|uniref:Malto-oligosyltrehalose trehalohydrolase n=1 Tax=Caulifigura coniformis TaxID=2527983 RepID=A0A517SAH9_9PLAN|nr:malto-oligosyltrehalose trehalohydrolase [Caulifigura coniformis]QDT53123.1 Malto-oligosyltrehalose trehalohydrolase [Caulifigura coniformis]